MTDQTKRKAITVRDIRRSKAGTPIVCLTAYTTPMARLLDPHADMLLVGDSLAMVLYGHETTLSVTLDTMIAHGAAVKRGTKTACLVVDMPFGSYQESPQQAFRNSVRVMAESGCDAVKLEGGRDMAETIEFLTVRGVPVLGHIGLMPQMVNQLGGFRTQGRNDAEAQAILADAKAVEAAGAFAMVIEGTVEQVARQITNEVEVPTIGIGASPACDGQVLVTDDLLGMSGEKVPSFVKRYATIGETIDTAVGAFAEDVRARRFPEPKQCYGSVGEVRRIG